VRRTDNDNPPASGKTAWRARIRAERAAVPPEQRAEEAAALSQALAELRASTVCAYVPFGTEPGSRGLLDVLRAQTIRVLLPVIPDEPGPLDWAEYGGPDTLAPGAMPSVLEPTGSRLGPRVVAEADVVLVPALAVDHVGVRLGKGGGYYDRSLVLAARTTRFVAVVRDSELVDRLPSEPHDVRVHAAVTPRRGLVHLAERPEV
jgi:5-formyltetrahydrofolate cyclo-ligase